MNASGLIYDDEGNDITMDALTEAVEREHPNGIYFCPFCQRIADDDVITVDPYIVRFAPLNPVVQGHMLFVPRNHAEHPDPGCVSFAMGAAEAYARAAGHHYNLITSSGRHATMTVPHIHVHYVPRREGDGLHLPWTGQQR